jgi:hypothetical protein
MTIQGTIRGGLVVLDEAVHIPDGTKVAVFVPAQDACALSTEAKVARQKAALAELLAIPNENPGDTFSGQDHDQILYGEPG